MVSQDDVMNALRPVMDPEIGLSVVDLGLIYGVDISEDGKKVEVSMTLTSPMCPYGPHLVAAAETAVASVAGVEESKVQLVWVPRWDPREHASEEAKAYLGIW
jgi:metal-sulfur cluster biosynthetic enzyme